MDIAYAARSVSEGKSEMDQASQRFDGVLKAFAKAEAIQTKLANLLEKSRDALMENKTVQLIEIIGVYTELQGTYNEIVKQLAPAGTP